MHILTRQKSQCLDGKSLTFSELWNTVAMECYKKDRFFWQKVGQVHEKSRLCRAEPWAWGKARRRQQLARAQGISCPYGGSQQAPTCLSSVCRTVWESLRFCAIHRQFGLKPIKPVYCRATAQTPRDEGSSTFSILIALESNWIALRIDSNGVLSHPCL